MPPLPVLCRTVLAGTLKGSPVQIEQLPANGGGETVQLAEIAGQPPKLTTAMPRLLEEVSTKQVEEQTLFDISSSSATASHDGQAETAELLAKSQAEATISEMRNPLIAVALKTLLCLSILASAMLVILGMREDRSHRKKLAGGNAPRATDASTSQSPELGNAHLCHQDQQAVKQGRQLASALYAPAEALQCPAVCPPYMRADKGADLSLRIARNCWSSAVSGLGLEAVRGPAVPLLTANVRCPSTSERVLEFREHQPGASTGEEGPILLTVTSDLEFWMKTEAQEDAAERHFGSLEAMQLPWLNGGSRRMFVWKQAQAKEASLAVSIGADGMQLELGSLPSGQLLATASKEPDGDEGSIVSVSVKPGIDAALALASMLAVLVFAPDPSTSSSS